jgi:Fur family ferric uptake transcriptional regulator
LHRDEIIAAFRDYLRGNGLPITAQRLVIAEIVLGSSEHLSAEDVMIELGRRGAYAGTATVYRTLELLIRGGLAVERDFGEGFKRYEAAHGIPAHEHLQCTFCGKIVEFRDEGLEEMATRIAQQNGFVRVGHRLVITGVCLDCRVRAVRAGERFDSGGES